MRLAVGCLRGLLARALEAAGSVLLAALRRPLELELPELAERWEAAVELLPSEAREELLELELLELLLASWDGARAPASSLTSHGSGLLRLALRA